jgi:hypothetical protein
LCLRTEEKQALVLQRANAGDDPGQSTANFAVLHNGPHNVAVVDAVILLREGESLAFGAHHGPIPMDFVT